MLQTAFSSYWILLCLLIGAVYAIGLYSIKKYPWPKAWNLSLATLRFAVVSLICFLFLEPYFNQKDTEFTPAKVAFLWDDTESIPLALNATEINQAWTTLHAISDKLKAEKEVDIVWETVSGKKIDNSLLPKGGAQVSHLQQAMERIKSQNTDNALQEVVIISDGIYNLGPAPDYFTYPFLVTSVGLGDSSIKKDIAIQKLNYNKIAYEGNQFPIVALITKSGFGKLQASVSLVNDGKTIKKDLVFQKDETVKEVEFLIDATKIGYRTYTVNLETAEEELNTSNNRQSAYINVIEGKKNIVLLADAPHPDINAIKSALSGNDNYDLKLVIAGINTYDPLKYDLAILFHLPNINGVFEKEINALKRQGVPMWFVVGGNTSASSAFNSLNQAIRLSDRTEVDKATVRIDPSFIPFNLEGQGEAVFSGFPPIVMPFNEASVNPLAEVLFYKQVGQINTEQPVATYFEQDDYKQATTMLEGFWRWRMYEYRESSKFKFFDDWITKTVRWLTTQSTKEQFNVYPNSDRYSAFEPVVMSVESYNEVFEPVFGNAIKLEIGNKDTLLHFNFKTVNLDTDFNVGNLPSGTYNYSANTIIADKPFSSKGQFLVEENNIENLNLQANFDVLRRLSRNNAGEFIHFTELNELEDHLLNQKYSKTISGTTKTSPLQGNYWLYVFILAALFIEWFVRRFYGSY